MKSIVGWLLAVAALLGAVVPFNAVAQHRDRGWHGDIRHFDQHDMHRWRSGAWRHGSHGGRVGWWWVASGTWYHYPQPVYPYPDPYRPPVIVVEQAAPAIPQPAIQFWYYCEAAGAYYPYVATCPSGWKTVPATPPEVTP